MKTLLRAFVALLFTTQLVFGATALDIRIQQRNASNTAWPDVILPGTPNLYIGTDGTGRLTLLAGGGGGGGGGTVTSASVVTANGVSAAVANPTTTPAFTFTLGAITPSSISATGAIIAGTTFTATGAAAPTTSTAGQWGFDNNAWAASRGAFQLFDGTANTYVIGALASDTPTNGQVLKWNTGGTITWEDDTGAAGTTVGMALYNLANPGAITFIRINADNSATALSDSNYRTALGLVAVAASGSATDITAGTLADARIPSNITRNSDFDTAAERAALGFKTTTHGGLEVLQAHGAMGATETFDLATANVHTGTLDAALTVTLSGFTAGKFCSAIIGLLQNGTGNFEVTWPAAVVTAPTVTLTANAITWISLWSTDGGTTIYASGTADNGTRTGVVREIWIGAGAMTPSAVNGAAAASYEPAGADAATIDVFDFDDTTSESVQFTIAMPSTWNLSTVKVKVYWTSISGTGTVIWGIAAGAASDDNALGAILGTQITVTDTRLADNDLHISPATAAVTVGGTPALDDLTLFNVVRDISDTKTGDARLIGVKLQYTESTTEPAAW